MPIVKNGEAEIYYEISGTGFPVLLLASGFMRSRIDSWSRHARMEPSFRFDPLVELQSRYTLVAMDQRNAFGRSFAPVDSSDDWSVFLSDQIAVMDELGFDRFHVWGSSIGASFALGLCQQVPDRIASAVLMNGMGVSPENPGASLELFAPYAEQLDMERPDISASALTSFGKNLLSRSFDKEFTFSVTRDFLVGCEIPMLVLPAYNDPYHPFVTAEEIAKHAPQAELVRNWTDAASPDETLKLITSFFDRHHGCGRGMK